MELTKPQQIKEAVDSQIKSLQAQIEDLQTLSMTATPKECEILGARMAGIQTGLGSLILISSKL